MYLSLTACFFQCLQSFSPGKMCHVEQDPETWAMAGEVLVDGSAGESQGPQGAGRGQPGWVVSGLPGPALPLSPCLLMVPSYFFRGCEESLDFPPCDRNTLTA